MFISDYKSLYSIHSDCKSELTIEWTMFFFIFYRTFLDYSGISFIFVRKFIVNEKRNISIGAS